MRFVNIVLIVTLIFGSALYSQEVKEETQKKKSNFFLSPPIFLILSLTHLHWAKGENYAAKNAKNSQSDIYSLAILGYENQPENKRESYVIATLGFADLRRSTAEFHQNLYQYNLDLGTLFGVLFVLITYYDYKVEKNNKEASLNSMITPFLNWSTKSAEIGISFRF